MTSSTTTNDEDTKEVLKEEIKDKNCDTNDDEGKEGNLLGKHKLDDDEVTVATNKKMRKE